MSYGFCGCGCKIVSRTRGIPSVDTCEMGHKADSAFTCKIKPQTPLDGVKWIESSDGHYEYKGVKGFFEAYSLNDKFVTPEPLPTDYENELLDILIEECAEVIQRATKMKRFGVMEIQCGQGLTNAERLSEEFGDLKAVVELCLSQGMMDYKVIKDQIPKKMKKLNKYMQTSSGREQ